MITWNKGENVTAGLLNSSFAEKAGRVPTIATLRTLRVPQDGDADTILLQGGASMSDGAGSVFGYMPGWTAADDGAITIKPNSIASGSPGAWVRLFSGPVNVKWFGAKGDGTTDDSAAIQAAINYGGRISVPAATYLINSALNLTNKSGGGVSLEGEYWAEGGGGTVLKANTGGVALDLSGSQHIHLENLVIDATGAANPSTVGILYARTTTSQYAQFNSLERVFIKLPSSTTANGNNGTVGIYNYASELWRANNIYVVADNPAIFTNSPMFGITSPFQTLETTIWSMSECSIDGDSTLTSSNGPALYIGGAQAMDFRNIYLYSTGTPSFKYAAKITGGSSIHLSGHFEGFSQVAYINNNIANLKINGEFLPDASGDPAIYLDGSGTTVPGIVDGEINLYPLNSNAHSLITTAGSQNGVRECLIHLYENQSLNIAGGYTTGNIIKAHADNPTINLSGQGYYSAVVVHQGGIKLLGNVEVNDPATFDQSPTVHYGVTFVANSSTPANMMLFVDPADGKLKYKDGSGTVNLLY